MRDPVYPPWVVLHIPHDATWVPDSVRSQFILSDTELTLELARMTDHYTHRLFAEPSADAVVVRSPVSRLVVDVERFEEDANEPMAAIGMGVVYSVTSQLAPLRRPLSADMRETLINTWYRPHHARLEAAVASSLAQFGHCLVIDCHSFPGTALPYESVDEGRQRPDICIGCDTFHTPVALEQAFVTAFQQAGWSVAVNEPFAGAIVPASRYGKDPRVFAIMIEVNRNLYLDRQSTQPCRQWDGIAGRIRQSCAKALDKWSMDIRSSGRV